MTNKLEIGRELASVAATKLEYFASRFDDTFGTTSEVAKELRALLASPVVERQSTCATCDGKRIVDDGELTHSSGGIPYENGPIRLVKDCPDCQAALPPIIQTLPADGGISVTALLQTIAHQAKVLSDQELNAAALCRKLQSQAARIADLEHGRVDAPFYVSVEDWNTLVRDDVEVTTIRTSRTKRSVFTEPLYAEQPAPVAVPTPAEFREAFVLSKYVDNEQAEDLAEIATKACLDKVKEMNQ